MPHFALLVHMRVCLVHVLLAWVVTAAASSRSLIIDGPGLAPRSVSNAQGRLPTRVAVAASCSDVERFAAGLLVDRLNSASSSSAFHLVTEGGISQQPVIAVGFGAASALGTSVVPSAIFQQLSQDDDAYFLALAPGGSIALAAGRTSGRGAVNAVYGFLRDGLGIYILSHNVTDVPTGPLELQNAAFNARVVVPSFLHMARAALPCSSDWACESNFSGAMGFNGYFAHNPVGKRDSPLHELYTPPRSNQSFWIGSQSHSIYKLLSPMEAWVDDCLNESSVGWPITAGGTKLTTVPCPSVLKAHPSWFSCMNGTSSGVNMSEVLWPCPFDKMYGPVQPEGKFYSGRSHVCWTGDSSLTTALIAGLKQRLDAVPAATLISVSAQDGAPAVCAPDLAVARDAGMDAYVSTNALGRYSPAMLTVLVKVANAIAVSHPGVRIETLAYDGSMEPPLSGIVLPDNVIVTLCLSGRDASAPLSATRNAAWQARIAGWQKVTKHLRIWAYTDGGGPAPRPNWMNVGDDLTYLATIGVEGYFSEGDGWPLNEYLKNYVIARKTFNASLDSRAVVAEFNNKFFGKQAGGLVTQYNTLLHESMAAAPTVKCTWPPSCQAPGRQGPMDETSKGGPGYSPYSTIFPSETILEANSVLASAASKVHSNPELAARVHEARLPIVYVLLVRWDDVCAHAIKTKATWPVSHSKRDVFDGWAASFNASVNAVHGPWLPQQGKYKWVQWGENRCDKACFEREIFQNNTYPVCSARRGG